MKFFAAFILLAFLSISSRADQLDFLGASQDTSAVLLAGHRNCSGLISCDQIEFRYEVFEESLYEATFGLNPISDDQYLAFDFKSTPATSYFMISNPATSWELELYDGVASIPFFVTTVNASGAVPTSTYYKSLTGYSGSNLIVVLKARTLPGYHLSPSNDPTCASFLCMPVSENTVGVFGSIAIGSVPEPEPTLLALSAVAVVVAFVSRRRGRKDGYQT